MNESVFGDVLQQFSERFAESENFSQIGGGEIGACAPDVRTFATNLNHADHFVTGKNRRADNFLYRFAGVNAAGFNAFENSRVTRRRKTIVYLGAAFANRSRGESGIAR